MPSAPPCKNPDSPRTIPSPPRSTTDAHVALQQLSHHVPYQVLPPNGGERKWGRGRIWVGREEGWVLNLDGRDRVMNINLFLSFSIQKKEPWLCIWSSWFLLCLDYLRIITFFFKLHPPSLFCLPRSLRDSFSLIWFWMRLRWWPAPMFPSRSQEAPGSRVEEGPSVRRCLPIGAAG